MPWPSHWPFWSTQSITLPVKSVEPVSEPEPQAPGHRSQNWTHVSIYTGLSATAATTAAEAAYCSKGTAHTYNCLFPTAYTPKISKSQQIYHCLSMTHHRQHPQQIGKSWFKGPVLRDLCFPLETEYAKQAPRWRKQLSWDAEGKWWITRKQMLFGKMLFCNSIMQSLSNGFPTHWFFLPELLQSAADVWKAGHYTWMSSKTRTAIKFIQPQCWPQDYLHCPGSKMYSQWAAPQQNQRYHSLWPKQRQGRAIM